MTGLLPKALGLSMVGASLLYKRRFDADARRARKVNEETLMGILERNRDTEIGRRYGFASLRSTDAFRKVLPLVTYEHFREDIARMASGEQTASRTSWCPSR